MLCASRRKAPLIAWLGLPLLFVAAAAGVGGVLFLTVREQFELSGLLFGPAAAIAVYTSRNVAWTASWQRIWLRWGYVAALVAAGTLLDGVAIPTTLALPVGVISAAAFIAVLRHEREPDDVPHVRC